MSQEKHTIYSVRERNYDKIAYKTHQLTITSEGQSQGFDELLENKWGKLVAVKLSSNLPAMAYNRGVFLFELDNKRIFEEGFEAKNLVSGVHVPHDWSFFELQRTLNGGKMIGKYTDTPNPAYPFPAGGYTVSLLLMLEEK